MRGGMHKILKGLAAVIGFRAISEAEIVQEKEKARHFGEPVNFFKFVFLFLLFLL